MTISREELRTLFLFEALDDEQLDWLAERGEVRTYDTGAVLGREGEPAEHFFVLLEGRLRLSRVMGGEDVVVNETDHRGAYGGATRSYVEEEGPYAVTLAAAAPTRVFRLPGNDFAHFVQTTFPMAVHLLDGLYVGIRNSEAQVRQREHLAALGTLSANLAHELNNPAAASVRATSQLRSRLAGMRAALGQLADGTIPAASLRGLVELQARAVEQAAKADRGLTPVQLADREDELSDRLDELGVPGGYELAPVLAAAGVDLAWVEDLASCVEGPLREVAFRWLAHTLEAEALMSELEDASGRISTLVASVKDYSRMDGATAADVDVHAGLDSTIIMLGAKLAGLDVVKEYDRDLPLLPAFPAELNQVWTNLLDNAAGALAGRGTIVVRTRREGGWAVVEVVDDGPGIAPEVLPRIFEAFFTTAPAGAGSGLGLDNVKRIVERRHAGVVEVDTVVGEGTAFRVRLPLERAT